MGQIKGIDLYINKSYNFLCKNVLLPLSDIVTSQNVMNYFNFIEKAQWWPRDRLIEYQNSKLRETIKISYDQVPFYRELFDKNKLKPNDIVKHEDLVKIPFVTKEMLKKVYPQGCTRRTGYKWEELFTSGSTGSPFAVRIDKNSMSTARALMIYRATFSGWEIGERFLQTGMTLNRGVIKKMKDILLQASYVSAFNLSDNMLDNYLDVIDSKKIKYIMGYASSLFCLAERAEKIGFNYSLHGIVSWGDNMFENYRRKIEKQFKTRVTDTYGCGEGIQVAAQCGQSNGEYHIFMPHVIVEFVDDGIPVVGNEMGEILLTRLDPGAMPLIRYKIGDVGCGSTKTCCTCGRGLQLMGKVDGRSSDIIITPKGNKLIVHFFTGIFEYYPSIKFFQVIQEKNDEINIKIVPNENYKDSDSILIKNEIKEKGDPDLIVNFEIVSEIPLEKSNKRRFVISKICK